MATASRPYGFFGKPLLASDVISVQVFPPSVERNNPLAEGAVGIPPPERYSQPLRRKSHIAANMISGLLGSISRSVHPVERFAPFKTCCQVLKGANLSTGCTDLEIDPSNPDIMFRSEEHTSELQ